MNKVMQQLTMMAYTMFLYGGRDDILGKLYTTPQNSEKDEESPSRISPSDKTKLLPKELHEFIIKGIKIMATSKKDAIKKYKHHKK